jgi:hypothetical protein
VPELLLDQLLDQGLPPDALPLQLALRTLDVEVGLRAPIGLEGANGVAGEAAVRIHLDDARVAKVLEVGDEVVVRRGPDLARKALTGLSKLILEVRRLLRVYVDRGRHAVACTFRVADQDGGLPFAWTYLRERGRPVVDAGAEGVDHLGLSVPGDDVRGGEHGPSDAFLRKPEVLLRHFIQTVDVEKVAAHHALHALRMGRPTDSRRQESSLGMPATSTGRMYAVGNAASRRMQGSPQIDVERHDGKRRHRITVKRIRPW